MFNYLFKNIPTEFLYGGYLVKKGLSSSTAEVNGKIIYDAFLYSYVDQELSLFIKMEDGSYKSINENVNMKEITNEELVSKHLERGDFVDITDYGEYDKNKPYGVFIDRDFTSIVKEEMLIDAEDNLQDAGKKTILNIKKSFSGMEAMGYIGRFNRRNKLEKKEICIPPIKIDANDEMESVIGTMEDYKKMIEGKTNTEIMKILTERASQVDSVGNKVYESLGM